ncbi:MAG: hypothetical protein ACC700_12210 [Anaerolineales bacterium]
MKLPTSLSDEELTKYADEHIFYEIDMLAWTASFLIAMKHSNPSGPLATAVSNSFLDAFAVHARNLVDFLYKRDSESDQETDIVVQDYVDGSKLEGVLPEMTSALGLVNRKANKQVAHLTIERLVEFETQGKEWKFGQIAVDIMSALNAISHLFPPAVTSEAFRQMIIRPPNSLIQISAREDVKAASWPSGLILNVDFNPRHIST